MKFIIKRSLLGFSLFLLLVVGIAALAWQGGMPRDKLSREIAAESNIFEVKSWRISLATWLWNQSLIAWSKKEWNKMPYYMEGAILLDPHDIAYSDLAAWQMAWNASEAALNNKDLSLEHRNVLAHEDIQRGRAFLEQGIRNNPESSLLYEHLGILLRDKLNDHLGAAKAFNQAAILPGAASYDRRFAAYELAECPGKEEAAYEALSALYGEGEAQRVPTLLRKIEVLRKKLHQEK